MKIGAQLFSVRDKLTNNDEIYNTLKKIKEIGYTSVQVSGFPYDAKHVKNCADEFGLHIGLTHTYIPEIVNNTDKVIQDHLTLGADVVGIGMPHGFYDAQKHIITDVKGLVETLKEPIKKINDAGLEFGYHNHDMEFNIVDGIRPIDYIFNETSWQMILDTGWVDYVGCDAVEYINKFNGRIKYVHLKDFREANSAEELASDRIVSIFSGATPVEDILTALSKCNVDVAYVEQDSAPNFPDSLEEMKKSYDAIKNKGWIK